MRGFRSTFILLVVFLGLVGYVYFYERRSRAETRGSAEAEGLHGRVRQDRGAAGQGATGDRLDPQEGQRRRGRSSSRPDGADDNEATGIATNLSQLESQRVVDENPADLSQYGLAGPRMDVAFRAAGDKDFTHLYLGDKTATGGDLYAKLPGEKRVFLVSSFLDTTFNRTTFDLRDKAVLMFDRDKVDQVEVTSGDQALALAKTGGEWKLTRPVEARADLSAVEALIGRMQTAQMKAIAAAERRREGPRAVRPRQAGQHRRRRLRQHARDAGHRQGGRGRQVLRPRPVAAHGLHGRSQRSPTI